jgi:hypothetical protein
MALSVTQVTQKVTKIRDAARARDQRQKDVRDIRSNDVDTVMPSLLPDKFPKPIVANLVNTVAKDYSELMGTMPSINCTSGVITSQAAKKFSAKRTKIAHYWAIDSKLYAGKQVEFCDHYLTYGMGIYCVEPDFETGHPVIRVENPIGCYPEWDLFGRLISFTKSWHEEAIHLVAKYPQLQRLLQGNNSNKADMSWAEREIEVIKYIDRDQYLMYLPELGETVIGQTDNPMGEVMISIAKQPGYDNEIRGMFDDAIWPQLAKGQMALLALEGVHKSVRATMAIPRDVQKLTIGDDSVVRTDNPDKIRYIAPDYPQYAMQESQSLEQELMKSTRYNEARSGAIDASIITGKGVQALMGSFNTVVTTGQAVVGEALRVALEMAFKMDEKIWPNTQKVIRGMVNGTAFEETYTPSKDIKGVYTVDVTYGFAAGQDPARAIVALLQLRGDQLVSRDFVQRQLPMDIDIVQLQTQIDNEQLNDALKQGMMAYLQQLGQIASQGGDVQTLLTQVAQIIAKREKGTPFHEAVLEAFTPKTPPASQQAPGQMPGGPPGPGGGGGGPQGPGGIQALPQGVAPGQQGMAPGGRPDLLTLLAGMHGGNSQMGANIQRRLPAGG